jgi:hypothetical protein
MGQRITPLPHLIYKINELLGLNALLFPAIFIGFIFRFEAYSAFFFTHFRLQLHYFALKAAPAWGWRTAF